MQCEIRPCSLQGDLCYDTVRVSLLDRGEREGEGSAPSTSGRTPPHARPRLDPAPLDPPDAPMSPRSGTSKLSRPAEPDPNRRVSSCRRLSSSSLRSSSSSHPPYPSVWPFDGPPLPLAVCANDLGRPDSSSSGMAVEADRVRYAAGTPCVVGCRSSSGILLR